MIEKYTLTCHTCDLVDPCNLLEIKELRDIQWSGGDDGALLHNLYNLLIPVIPVVDKAYLGHYTYATCSIKGGQYDIDLIAYFTLEVTFPHAKMLF